MCEAVRRLSERRDSSFEEEVNAVKSYSLEMLISEEEDVITN